MSIVPLLYNVYSQNTLDTIWKQCSYALFVSNYAIINCTTMMHFLLMYLFCSAGSS